MDTERQKNKLNKGTIVLLVGVSSSGKTTIIKEIIRQDKQKSKKNRVNWIVDGCDLEYWRLKEISDMKNITAEKMSKNIFMRAIKNAKQGYSSILDFVPFRGKNYSYNITKEFFNFLKKENLKCLTYVALIHCNIDRILKHMDLRNSLPDKKEKRKNFFSFKQYGATYSIIKEKDKREIVGKIKLQDIMNAYKKYGRFSECEESIFWKDCEDFKFVVENLGITEDCKSDKIFKVGIKPSVYYDKIYQTYPYENLKNLVKDIDNLSGKENGIFHKKI